MGLCREVRFGSPQSFPGAGGGFLGAGEGEQGRAAERDVPFYGEEPYVLSPLVDPTGLDASSRDASSRDLLGRGRAKHIGAGEDTGAGRNTGAGGGGIWWASGSVTVATCKSATCTAVVKVWRAMRRALRALGERASTTDGVAMEWRSSGRSPPSVCVHTPSVCVCFFTSLVLKGLLKESLPLTVVLKVASATKFRAESSLVTTAAKTAGAILKSSVPFCGRGAGKLARVAASLPLTAVLKLESALKFQAESSLVATAARKADSILKPSVASCGRGAGEKSREAISLVAILIVRAGSDNCGIRGRKSISNCPSSGPEPGRPDGEERSWVAWRALLPGLSDG